MARNGDRIFDADTHVGPVMEALNPFIGKDVLARLPAFDAKKKVNVHVAGGYQGHTTYTIGERSDRRKLGNAEACTDKTTLAGAPAGAGMDVALICDLRFAARSARSTEAYVKVGLLPRVVGLSRALHLLWTGDFIGAEDVEKFGLVDVVYNDDRLVQETQAFAGSLAGMPPVAVRMIKRAGYTSP